jgi:hypothetical protein
MQILLAAARLSAAASVALSLLLPADPARAAPATALGPEVQIAAPSGGYRGRLRLEPQAGPAGTRVTATAEDLPPGEEFQLVWGTVTGRWKVENGEYKGRAYRSVGYEIARMASDAGGRLEVSFAAPEDFGFLHDIILQQKERLFTKAGFDLQMTMKISPASGPIGTLITVEVTGIGWRHLENSWLLLYDNNFTGSAVTTAGAARFTIPATGAPGDHLLELLHGDFTFPYRNMQQSPAPDRPRFVRRFTITDGAAVLPPIGRQVETDLRLPPQKGELVSEPRFSAVGDPLTVRGLGFEAGRTYALNWTSVSGNRVTGSGWEEWSRVLAEATADASGRLEFRLATPDDLGGAHTLSVDAVAAIRTGAHWIVPSAAPLDVAQGPVGTEFRIRLKGVGWTETANIYTVVYDNSYIGYGCGFNSQGDAEFILHAAGEPGWHFIDLYPAIYKGAETRPINFRLPQLTFREDHPGEDLPRFRFAFRVTAAPPAEER